MVSKAAVRSRRMRIESSPESEAMRRSSEILGECSFSAMKGTEARLKLLVDAVGHEVIMKLRSDCFFQNFGYEG